MSPHSGSMSRLTVDFSLAKLAVALASAALLEETLM